MPITDKRREILLSLNRGSLLEVIQVRANNVYRHLARAQEDAKRAERFRKIKNTFNLPPKTWQQLVEDEYFTKRGYVYVIYFGIGNIYKIGVSTSPEQRRSSFSGVLTPFDMTLEHLIRTDDAKLVESALHEFFIRKHIRGEWFALDHDDLEMIKCIKELVIYTEGYYGNTETLPTAI